MSASEPRTFLLVDGENIDATLGAGLLGRRPAPEERPRWDRVRDYARAIWEQPARGLFFLNASGQVPLSFVQALTTLEFRPVLLSGAPEIKVVDVAIQKTLEALAERGRGDVLLASHDSDFAPQIAAWCAPATGGGWACCASASWSPRRSPTWWRRGWSSTTSRTTSGRSRSRCRARA